MASSSTAPDRLVRGNGPEPDSLDPQRARNVESANVLRDLYEGLTIVGPDGAPAPGVARAWSVSPDGLRWTFVLRPEARWSNGDPVTAHDFVFGWRTLLDPRTASEYAFIAFGIRNAEAVNAGRLPVQALGVRAADARTLEVLDEHEALVAPERLGEAQLDALAINGFTTAAWEHALPLREALLEVAPLLEGVLVAGHNVGFDWAFLEAGFRRAGLALPNVDYHRLDTASLAWPLVVTGELPSMSLEPLAKLLGLERPHPHRALADARCSLEVARRLVERGVPRAVAAVVAKPSPKESRPAREAQPAKASGGSGSVRIAVSPWGNVEVNGTPVGTTPPLNELTLPEGKHQIVIRNADFPPYSATISVAPGQAVNLKHKFGS